ncbi:Zn-dependent peptidase ImmA, M78 family [Desulfurella multipotens]|uniref:Zn-dependent peptidase ImmA, M78 family n=1 Tax=Desulfurella multipotens TaxID=79269 RepID=A0A1G6Q103_9BACT|nr:ImmA/IrrE family metallo-endopeptidase [Desulfurella multipotens]SDC86120.1 Zn-dependent peptidase ImmA, M78 family [Desulfurella multipotens]
MKVTNINVNILEELSQRMPEQTDQAKNKFPKYDKWIKGVDYPTYNQLIELSKIFHIPFGYFFLEKLPERKYPIPHYRTLQDGDFVPSNELLETIQFAQKIQEWAKEILLEWGQEKLPYCGKYKDNYNAEEVLEKIKDIFEIQDGWASRKSTWTEALNYLIDKAEEKGIIVLRNGVVGNNTRLKLNVNEFRGFVLYDEIAPVVFINNNDAISAKIFTLIHEVVHILIGQSASFDLQNFQSANNRIEIFCDKCTAEFLVPEEEIRNIYRQKTDLEGLAGYFKVSQIVILRRLLDTSIITQQEFYEQFKKLYKKEIKAPQSFGGNFYQTLPTRLSKRFLHILNTAVKNNTILFRDALRITNLSSKTYDTLIQRAIWYT